jgi:3-hydroxypropanoate dehydrogenase
MHPRNTPLGADILDTLFLEARTHYGWTPRPVEDSLLHQLWTLARLPPTSANSNPMRLVFVKSPEAKERLKPALSAGNVEKTMTAPVTVIVAYDTRFHEHLPRLFPARDMKAVFDKLPPEAREKQAFMNAALQGAYLILAARALGLDCGPMAGFDNAKVDAAFLVDTSWKSQFLINLGYGDPASVKPRAPRLEFDEACRIE